MAEFLGEGERERVAESMEASWVEEVGEWPGEVTFAITFFIADMGQEEGGLVS